MTLRSGVGFSVRKPYSKSNNVKSQIDELTVNKTFVESSEALTNRSDLTNFEPSELFLRIWSTSQCHRCVGTWESDLPQKTLVRISAMPKITMKMMLIMSNEEAYRRGYADEDWQWHHPTNDGSMTPLDKRNVNESLNSFNASKNQSFSGNVSLLESNDTQSPLPVMQNIG